MTSTDQQTRRWLDTLVVELRLREVRGDAIGDAVASVESYCAESGQTPQEAFGDPRAYAGQLEFPATHQTRTTTSGWLAIAWPVVTGMLAIGLGAQVGRAVGLHRPVETALGVLLAPLLVGVLTLVAARTMTSLVRRPLVGAAAIAVAFVVITLVGLVPGPVLAVPVWVAAAVVVALLAGTVVGMPRAGGLADPVVDPRDGKDRYASPKGAAAGSLVAALSGWVVVVVTLVMGVLAWSAAR